MIAFLFLIYEDFTYPRIWTRFFQASNANFCVLIHSKHGTPIKDAYLEKFRLNVSIPTKYADISLVKVMLFLAEKALEDHPSITHFIYLCGRSLPTKSLDYIHSYITSKLERSFFKVAHQDQVYPRGDTLKRHFSQDMIYKTSQWIVLSRSHALCLLEHRTATILFEKVYAPEEFFFLTMLMALGVKKEALVLSPPENPYECVMYTAWRDGKCREYGYSERNIVMQDLVSRKDVLFARKFI